MGSIGRYKRKLLGGQHWREGVSDGLFKKLGKQFEESMLRGTRALQGMIQSMDLAVVVSTLVGWLRPKNT